MPVARIIAREQTGALIQRLQELGYTIEVIQPGGPHSGPADLDITAERHDPSAALARAQELAREHGCDVFVAPDVLGPLSPAVEHEPAAETPTLEPAAEAPMPEPAAEALTLEPAAEAPKFALSVERGVVFKQAFQAAVARFRQWREEWAEARHRRRELQLLQAAEYARELHEAEQERIRLALQAKEREESRRRNQELQRMLERAEQEQRHKRAEEERKRQEEERKRQEEERKRQEEERPAAVVIPSIPLASVGAAEQSLRHAPRVRLPQTRRSRPRVVRLGGSRAWRSAAKGTALIALLAGLIWLTIANRRPASPVPAAVLARSAQLQQAYPFGPVTLQPAHGRTQPVAVPQPARTAQKPAAQAKPAVPAKPHAGKVQPKRGARPAGRLRRSSGDDLVADDVVVRHYPAARPGTQAPQTAGVRRITDQD